MGPSYREVNPEGFSRNVFSLIADDWFLLTAGSLEDYNTMTASWGGLGELWNRKVSFVFVRPQRHTWGFMEKSGRYTMSFFGQEHREALKYCGSHSGRDVDKASMTGLTPFQPSKGTVSFQEARMIMVCRKLHFQDLDPKRFQFDWIEKLYPLKGYHRMYIGHVESILERDE